MPVEIIIDQWNPGKKKYRFETFCYGPLNYKLYKSGPIRKVPGRNGMVYEEEDWVDEEETGIGRWMNEWSEKTRENWFVVLMSGVDDF